MQTPSVGEPRLRSSVVDVRGDDDLIGRAQAGDHDAFARLLVPCDERMRGLAFRLLGSRSAMDDALQDAYVKAYVQLGAFHSGAAFAPWLHTIVRRTCLDHLRSRRRRREVDLEAVPEPSAEAVDIGGRLGDTELMKQALAALPVDQTAAVVLVDGEGLSYAEAADLLGVATGTVASRLNRGRAELRRRLSWPTDDEGGPR